MIVVLTDDQTVGTLQLMPNVRALAHRGTTFAHAFISNSLCCPSPIAVLTGLTSGHTGVWTNGDHDRRWGGWSSFTHNALTRRGAPYDGGDNDGRTIAVALRDAGYKTGLYGKYLNHYEVPGGAAPPIPPGWTNWFSFLGKNGGYYNYSISDQGHVERYGAAPHDYSTDVVGRAARGFLKSPGIQDGSRPFFLYYAPFAPHGKWCGVHETCACRRRCRSSRLRSTSRTSRTSRSSFAMCIRWARNAYGVSPCSGTGCTAP